jgi:hypothetical protein
MTDGSIHFLYSASFPLSAYSAVFCCRTMFLVSLHSSVGQSLGWVWIISGSRSILS